MVAFLETLAARALGQAPLLAVRARARFEPPAEASASIGSDPPEPPAVPMPERLGMGRMAPGQTIDSAVTRSSVTKPVATEPVVTDSVDTELEDIGPLAEPATPDPVLTASAPAPARSSTAGVAHQPVDWQVDVETNRDGLAQHDLAQHFEPPTQEQPSMLGDREPSPEPVASQAVQSAAARPTRPLARQAGRPATTAATRPPDPVRATARRPPTEHVPAPGQLMTEHVVPALIRAGLVSPDGADDVRSAPTRETGDVRETVGSSMVPEVHVHIGRVEVNQAPTPNQPTPAPAPPARARPRLPAVDHDAYLERRRRSGWAGR